MSERKLVALVILLVVACAVSVWLWAPRCGPGSTGFRLGPVLLQGC